MKINFIGNISEIEDAVSQLSCKMDFCVCREGTEVKVSKRKKAGLDVRANDGEYTISYGIIPDFCRALCILIDKIEKGEKNFNFSEDRIISRGGIMADVSRNAVLKVETAKDIISRIARMGMNTFMLYMEDVYKIDDCPYFGYMRGAYTEEELKEIDEYAVRLGVEVVPCIQTLAHLTSTLRWPYAEGMRDTMDVLLVGADKTYLFIEKMISSVSRSLSSKRIHIGMDEAWGLGTGVYKSINGQVNKFDIIESHLSRVVEILNKYGKEPMMWSDMLFRIASKRGAYFDTEAVMPDNILEIIPENVTLAFWDYYNEKTDIYRDMLRIHKTTQRSIAFFGGVWTWNGIAINYDKTFRATEAGLVACHESGIDEICATLWRDDGAEIDIYTALLGMQLYSEHLYHESVSREQLDNMFSICTGYRAEDFLLFDLDNLPESTEYKKTLTDIEGVVTAAKHTLYQDILHGLFDKQYEDVDLKGHYKGIYEKLKAITPPRDLKELFAYHTQLAYVLYLKSDIGLRITKNYKAKEMDALTLNAVEVKNLYLEICDLHEKLSVLWFKQNKAFGIDRIDLRFGGLKERVNRAKSRLDAYIKGEINSIEELEEERLPFKDVKFPAYREYNSFISASIG